MSTDPSILRSAVAKLNGTFEAKPRERKPRKPRQSDMVSITFTGKVVYVHPNGQHIVIKDANGVETPLTWFGDTVPKIVVHHKEKKPSEQ